LKAGVSGGEIGAVLIAGPTASGKSALGIRLARELGGVVINADSMQVYRDLRVLTARPTPDEEAQAPHRLYGHVDGALNYSVGRYIADAVATLAALDPQLVPIFVGGTGLYFKALTDGLSDIPPVPEEVREAVRRMSEGLETPDLHGLLADRDPETAATLRPSDRMRVQRALEIVEATGRPLVSFHGSRQPGPLAGRRLVKVFLAPERDDLRRRIDGRFLAMMEHGALDEVRALAERGLDPMLPVMRAHGVPGLLAYLRSDMSLDEAIARGQGDTRRYAKRQFTWFRHQLPDWTWVAPETAFDRIMESGRRGAPCRAPDVPPGP
jgi:tRNA dimethylallyltransferase